MTYLIDDEYIRLTEKEMTLGEIHKEYLFVRRNVLDGGESMSILQGRSYLVTFMLRYMQGMSKDYKHLPAFFGEKIIQGIIENYLVDTKMEDKKRLSVDQLYELKKLLDKAIKSEIMRKLSK